MSGLHGAVLGSDVDEIRTRDVSVKSLMLRPPNYAEPHTWACRLYARSVCDTTAPLQLQLTLVALCKCYVFIILPLIVFNITTKLFRTVCFGLGTIKPYTALAPVLHCVVDG